MSWTIPLLLNGLGIGALWKAWSTKHAQSVKQSFRTVGFLCLMVGLYLWNESHGVEFGTTYWFIVSALLAWSIIGLNAESVFRTVNSKSQRLKHRTNHFVSWRRFLKSTATFVVSFLLTLVTSMIVCLSLAKWLPGSQANVLVGMAFLFPMLWSLLCCWVLSTEQRLKPILAMNSASLAALLTIAL